MSRRVIVRAAGDIPYGSRLLVRGARASVAGDDLANAFAPPRPAWLNEREIISDGQHFTAIMDEGIGKRDLHAIANGPIMDEAKIYLPAGKLSMEEFRARQRSIMLGDED